MRPIRTGAHGAAGRVVKKHRVAAPALALPSWLVAAQLIVVYVILLSPAAMALGVLIIASVSMLVDAWHCRHPAADLLQRVDAYPSTRIADEAQRWLDRQYRH
jgi:hypothetical protein